MRTNLRPSARAIDLPSDVLPTPGGPTKHRIGPLRILLQFAHGEMFDDAFFDFFEAVVIFIEDLLRLLQIQIVFGGFRPGQTTTIQSR